MWAWHVMLLDAALPRFASSAPFSQAGPMRFASDWQAWTQIAALPLQPSPSPPSGSGSRRPAPDSDRPDARRRSSS